MAAERAAANTPTAPSASATVATSAAYMTPSTAADGALVACAVDVAAARAAALANGQVAMAFSLQLKLLADVAAGGCWCLLLLEARRTPGSPVACQRPPPVLQEQTSRPLLRAARRSRFSKKESDKAEANQVAEIECLKNRDNRNKKKNLDRLCKNSSL